jgi:hypothetical protein
MMSIKSSPLPRGRYQTGSSVCRVLRAADASAALVSWLACHPQRAKTVPAGDDWQHEIKIDGFRVQIRKFGNEVELYSRNGSRFSRRFPRLVEVLRELRAKSAIVDGEIVASDVAGMPDFWPLFLRSAKPAELHVWAFDLLAMNGKDLRKWSLEARQGRLQAVVSRFDCPVLLRGVPTRGEKHGLEGVGEQAPISGLKIREMPRLAQNQDGRLARAQPRSMAPVREGLVEPPCATRF